MSDEDGVVRGSGTGRGAPAPRYTVSLGFGIAVLLGVFVALTIAPSGGVFEPEPLVHFGRPAASAVLHAAAVAAVGLSLLPLLIGLDRAQAAEPVLRKVRPIAAVASAVWAVAALITLVLQAAELYRSSQLDLAAIGTYVAEVNAGKALVAVVALALLHTVLGVLAVRRGERIPAELRAGLGVFALLPLPVTGHAASSEWQDITLVSIELHVLAAVAWAGGLAAVAVFLANNRTLLAHTLPRFSRLAAACLAVVTLTGVVNGGTELLTTPTREFWAALFGTGYGQLVLLKLGCVLVIAALAANIRVRLLPAIERHKRTALAGWVTLELTVLGLAFGVATVLSRTPFS
ncbi:putative copper resistance protein D [Tamaricihabitans halophyticus]|uniref:Putative copper resistance protein D n=1 Tax=Tamaricihabitans halophyticus TaxID=1262583 RepID=A0A4V2SUC3_9PSEU|nr:CopD family protein [Tamaricihabitans halophyticus]TCP54086.1 putative copper resistance protein D [Tamaricihabitans halophyticus]